MHVYSHNEYAQKQQSNLEKNFIKTIKLHRKDTTKIIKNYIYYSVPLKVN